MANCDELLSSTPLTSHHNHSAPLGGSPVNIDNVTLEGNDAPSDPPSHPLHSQGPTATPAGSPGGSPDGTPDNDGNDDNYQDDLMDQVLSQLTRAVASLAHSTTASRQPSKPQCRMKIHEPDQFDSSDPHKLHTFLVQCELNFQDHPKSFDNDCAKVIYTQSYLKGMALDWFEPELLLGNPRFRPLWMDNYSKFTQEL